MSEQLVSAASVVNQDRAISYLQTVMDPRSHSTMPDAAAENENAVPNSVDYSLTYDVTDPTPRVQFSLADATTWTGNNTQQEMCPSKEGLILHFPKSGPFSLFHMGFVIASVNAPVTVESISGGTTVRSLIRGLTLQGIYAGPMPFVANPYTFGNVTTPKWKFSWTDIVALPRADDGAINIGPDLEKNFSKVRLVAGVVQLEGAAVSISAATLTGTITTAVISDTRDLTVPGQCYSVASLAQQSVSRKDVIKTMKLDEGATLIVGPDYRRTYSNPRPLLATAEAGERLSFSPLFNANPIVNVPSNTLVQNWDVSCLDAWVSPWGTDFFVANGQNNFTANQYHSAFRTPSINETGVLEIGVDRKSVV